MLAPTENPRAVVGNNSPPGPIESAKEAMDELNGFLREHPVITSPAEAKNGGAYIERTRIALGDMEDERKIKVEPLNKQLTAINTAYRVVREPLEKVLKELRRRLTDYANAVEAARIAEANRLAAEREEAARIAREAEQREFDAIAAVDVGECADAGTAIVEADQKFAEFQKADRAAAVAAKNVPVRIGSVMGGKTLSMRSNPPALSVANVDDACKAIRAMGVTEALSDAICTAARAYHRAHEEYPPGITTTYERSF